MTEPTPAERAPELMAAAVLDDRSCNVDALLAAVARDLAQSGRCVRGVVMTRPDGDASCAAAMVLRDLHTGDEYLVSQSLGAASDSCRVDPQGFARASAIFRRALDDAPDLVISNRFGGLEAGGGGFRDELLDVLMQGVPLLTAVAPRHLEAWLAFTGGAAVLPAREEAIAAWLAGALSQEPDTAGSASRGEG